VTTCELERVTFFEVPEVLPHPTVAASHSAVAMPERSLRILLLLVGDPASLLE
jgi:hypothetical protein